MVPDFAQGLCRISSDTSDAKCILSECFSSKYWEHFESGQVNPVLQLWGWHLVLSDWTKAKKNLLECTIVQYCPIINCYFIIVILIPWSGSCLEFLRKLSKLDTTLLYNETNISLRFLCFTCNTRKNCIVDSLTKYRHTCNFIK